MSELRAGGDVLQVGVRRREASRGRHRLVQGGMDATITLDELGQGVEIGALDLGTLAIVEHVGHDSVLTAQIV